MANSYGVEKFNPTVPLAPYLKFKMGTNVYDLDTPNFLESFTFSRSYYARGNFTIVLQGAMDFDLEAKILDYLLKRDNTVSLQYGHSQGARSVWYRGVLVKYTPQFNSNFTATFTIDGMGEMFFGTTINRKFLLKDYDYRYSNLIKSLAKSEGWKIADPFITSDRTTDEEVDVVDQSTLEFIQKKLVPKTKKGGDGTIFIHNCHSDGVKVLLDAKDTTRVPNKEYNFVINAGNYGSVLSYEPQYNSTFYSRLNLEAGYVDRVTNQFTLFTNKTKDDLKKFPMSSAHMGATSVEEFNSLLQDRWDDLSDKTIGNTANLEIIGDPNIKPADFVNILPIRADGKLHISAGTYQAQTVTDNVNSGGYTTSLTLVKTRNSNSDLQNAYESGWIKS